MKHTSSERSYFNHRDDLARCTSGQHARVWLVWWLAAQRRRQRLVVRPLWRELALCWLLHHATGLIIKLAALRKRL